MMRVILESPYKELPGEDVVLSRELNFRYRQACIRDCLRRGESPFASHQMFTQALDDAEPEECRLGMEAGFAWHEGVFLQAVYIDRTITDGMRRGVVRFLGGNQHLANGQRRTEYRELGSAWDTGDPVLVALAELTDAVARWPGSHGIERIDRARQKAELLLAKRGRR